MERSAVGDHGNQRRNGGRRRRRSKGSEAGSQNKKRMPQRGMGVAELERLRLQGRQPHASPPQDTITHYFLTPFTTPGSVCIPDLFCDVGNMNKERMVEKRGDLVMHQFFPLGKKANVEASTAAVGGDDDDDERRREEGTPSATAFDDVKFRSCFMVNSVDLSLKL